MLGIAEHVIAEAVRDRGREGENIGEDPSVDRMDAEVRQGREHLGAVVYLVEFP